MEALVPLIPRSAYRKIAINGQAYWCFTRGLRIATLGKVRIVISFDNSELRRTYAVPVTNRRDWSAKEILAKYLQRWSIETFYRDSKQQLGLGEYRMRSLEAILLAIEQVTQDDPQFLHLAESTLLQNSPNPRHLLV